MTRADYYRQQADICLRMSLLCEDKETADLLIHKSVELLAQASAAESHAPPPPPPHQQPQQPAQQQQQIQPKTDDE
jgi:hypothetical protein